MRQHYRPAKINRRDFIKIMSAAGLLALVGGYCGYKFSKSGAKAKVVVIGGGAAGISVAARLMRNLAYPDVTIIDPSTLHFYQPGFTLIGGGVYGEHDVYRQQEDCIPDGAKWIKDSVVALDPDKRIIKTSGGQSVSYDFLVLTPGLQIDWNGVEGISLKTLGEGDAYCIYDHQGAVKTWRGIQKFVKNGGRGVYTDTYTKHKCGGAPKKICLLTEHLSRKQNARDKLKLDFFTASKELYDVPFFTKRLLEIYDERDVSITLNTRVKGVDTSAKKVYMQRISKTKKQIKLPDGSIKEEEVQTITPVVENYDFLHFLPPMYGPKFIREAGLAVEGGALGREGWAAVDKYTLVHPKYSNIVCLGDASSLPTSKTSAAIRKQVPIATANLISLMEGKTPEKKYDGYAACPIITDYGHVLLCEFDYDKKEMISFPFSMLDMSHEQWAAWLLKVYALKPMYFYGMLKGLA